MKKIIFAIVFALILSTGSVLVASAEYLGNFTNDPFHSFSSRNLSSNYTDNVSYYSSAVPNPPYIDLHPIMLADIETHGGDYQDPYTKMNGESDPQNYYNQVRVYAYVSCSATAYYEEDDVDGYGGEVSITASIDKPTLKNASQNIHIGKVFHGFTYDDDYYCAYPYIRYYD